MIDYSTKIKLIENAINILENNNNFCELCPRLCRVDRRTQKGYCGLDLSLKIFCINLHFGEEPVISGKSGSGTVFFSGCNLGCVYCQNNTFSHNGHGKNYSVEELTENLLKLQKRGAKNINFVTATPQLYGALKALKAAYEQGLKIPLVYNSGGYERVEILELLNGIVDIYLPDMKYSLSDLAKKFSEADDYVEKNQTAIAEMQRQVGSVLKIDEQGYVQSGIIIRHLILPSYMENSIEILKYIKINYGKNITISLMNQYFPTEKTKNFKDIGRRLTFDEYCQILEYFDEQEFEMAFVQEWSEDYDETN